MADNPMYHDGMRRLQDARDTRRIADRLEQVTVRTAFTDDDRAFIERCPMFFVATADADDRPDGSYGTAAISAEDRLRADFPGSVFVIRVAAERIFPNCPRYIHKMRLVEHSAYAPRPDYTPPIPAWKTFAEFRDALPARDRAGDQGGEPRGRPTKP